MNASSLAALVLLQEMPEWLAAIGVVGIVVGIVLLYAYPALCFQMIAQKTNTENGWWAWIPILNMFLMLKIAAKPMWWFVLMLIPLVNLVIAIIVLVAICQARGKSGWLVVGLMVPLVNFVVLGYLAFAE